MENGSQPFQLRLKAKDGMKTEDRQLTKEDKRTKKE